MSLSYVCFSLLLLDIGRGSCFGEKAGAGEGSRSSVETGIQQLHLAPGRKGLGR